MRTEALCAAALCALAASPEARADGWRERFEFGLAPELTLVGLAGGARLQVAWLPGGARSVSRVLLAPGLLAGPEFDYVPVSLGYRAVFRAGRIVRPLVGAGVEYQHRWVDDAPAARQFAVYLEAGSMFSVAPRWMVGAAVGLDATVAGGLGFGLLARVIVTVVHGGAARRAVKSASAPGVADARSSSARRGFSMRMEPYGGFTRGDVGGLLGGVAIFARYWIFQAGALYEGTWAGLQPRAPHYRVWLGALGVRLAW